MDTKTTRERRSMGPAAPRFTEADWEEESYRLFVERGDPKPCPKCGRTGFYGPRAADPGRKFHGCRFCGYWQEVGKRPVFRKPIVHGCDPWPECARAPYLWWLDPDAKSFHCPFCEATVPVSAVNMYLKGAAATSPAEDPEHAWWKVPQGKSYAFYLRFWENWPYTKGRVIL